MGSPHESSDQKEAVKLQNEELKRQKEAADKAARDADELTKAKSAGGNSLLTGGAAGVSSGYASLLGD